jgi:hypothetical protein
MEGGRFAASGDPFVTFDLAAMHDTPRFGIEWIASMRH